MGSGCSKCMPLGPPRMMDEPDVKSTTSGAIPVYALTDTVSGDTTACTSRSISLQITLSAMGDDDGTTLARVQRVKRRSTRTVGLRRRRVSDTWSPARAVTSSRGLMRRMMTWGLSHISCGGPTMTPCWLQQSGRARLYRWGNDGSYTLSAANLRKVTTGTMYTFQLMAVGMSTFTASEKIGGNAGYQVCREPRCNNWHGPDTSGGGGVVPRVAPLGQWRVSAPASAVG